MMNYDKRNFENALVMWEPSEEVNEEKERFIKIVEDKYKVKIRNYWDLHQWSIDHIEEFWGEMWDFSNIICSKKFTKVVDMNVPMNERPKWFEGAKLNFAENLLKFRSDRRALIVTGEDKGAEYVTYSEMYEKGKLYAAAFRKFGLKKGDRVVCYMSNRAEAIYAMLAVVSIGAIWSGALPLLGSQAVLNRFTQISPKVLLTVDRFPHDKEEIEILQKVKEVAAGVPSLEKVVIVPSKEESKFKDISGIRNSCFLDEFLSLGYEEDGSIPELEFEQVSVSHPVFINYTSGTTGLPKPIIHGSGPLLSTSRDYWLHHGERHDIIALSTSPVGWGSWNIFALYYSVGATIVIYEGVPFFISPTHLWDIIDEFKIKTLFATPNTLDDLEKKGYLPTEKHDLSSLKVLVSSGSIVKPHNYDFVYNTIKGKIKFFSNYGFTEHMGAGMMADSSLPLYRGEIACPSLGIHLECLDDEGNNVVGELGELVFAKPSPSMLIGIWNDEDGSLCKKTYFSKFPGKFAVGDLAVINPVTKGIIIISRSDETLKQRGCRFGSSEIYNVVNTFPEVKDSLCVSQYSKKGNERAVLFLKIRKGYRFNADLVTRIRLAIGNELTVPHIPDLILPTTGIPYNMNGKKMEILVKKMINKMPYNDETVINKESLEGFKFIPPYED